MAERSAVADEWETVDDDGFIYKRRKKAAALPPPASLLKSRNQVLSEQAELRVRAAADRRKKIKLLLAQKERYTVELSNWESLLREREESVACIIPPESPGDHNGQVKLQCIEDTVPVNDLESLHAKVDLYELHIQKVQELHALAEKLCEQFEKGVDHDKFCLQKQMAAKSTPRHVVHLLQDEIGRSTVSDNPLSNLWDRLLAATSDFGNLSPP